MTRKRCDEKKIRFVSIILRREKNLAQKRLLIAICDSQNTVYKKANLFSVSMLKFVCFIVFCMEQSSI